MDALVSPLENIVQGINAEYANSGNGMSPLGAVRRKVNIRVKTIIMASGWMTAHKRPSRDCL